MIEEYDLRGENNEESEKELEQVLRPQLFQDFSGQNKIIEYQIKYKRFIY